MTLPYDYDSFAPAPDLSPASSRRIVDIVVSAAALLTLAPVLMLVALAVWIEGGRPIFFSQTRLGKSGRHFRIYKFRKFPADVGTNGLPITVKNDGRMTWLGRILERTKLDETPQLWNVLCGDMSIVGPRPESLSYAALYHGEFRPLLDHTPGVFGPNQCLFRNECLMYSDKSDPDRFYREVLFPLKGRIDLAYFPSRTAAGDFLWVIRSVLAICGLRSPRLAELKEHMVGGGNVEIQTAPANSR